MPPPAVVGSERAKLHERVPVPAHRSLAGRHCGPSSTEAWPLAGGACRASPRLALQRHACLVFLRQVNPDLALEWAERVGSQLQTWPHGIGSPTPPISHTRTPTMRSAPIISSERSLLHALRCIRSNLKQQAAYESSRQDGAGEACPKDSHADREAASETWRSGMRPRVGRSWTRCQPATAWRWQKSNTERGVPNRLAEKRWVGQGSVENGRKRSVGSQSRLPGSSGLASLARRIGAPPSRLLGAPSRCRAAGKQQRETNRAKRQAQAEARGERKKICMHAARSLSLSPPASARLSELAHTRARRAGTSKGSVHALSAPFCTLSAPAGARA